MKKLLVFLLILAMLIPMGVVTHAQEAETKPFYLIQWGEAEGFDYVYEMPFFWANSAKLATPLESVAWGGSDYDIVEMAELLKEKFDAYPDGARYIMYTLIPTGFKNTNEDVVYVEEGVSINQEWLDAFLKEYKSIGGKLDGLIVDLELEDMSAYYLHSRHFVNDQTIYQRIYDNPLFDTELRPLLEERGFKYYENVTEATPELYCLHPSSGDQYDQSRAIWDAVIRSYMNGKITEACAPLWEYYPDAEMNDYQSTNMQPWLKQVNDFGGVDSGLGGNVFTAGTSSNENYYSVRPYSFFTDGSQQVVYKTIPGYNSAVYENKTFNYFMLDINIFRNVYLASDNGQVSWWIAHYLYNQENKQSASLKPYYAETIYHMGMLNPQMFDGYIIKAEVGGDDLYNYCLAIVDDCLKDLNRVAGLADREPINVAPQWNDHFMLSGMRVGNKNIYRLTPDTDLVSVEDFQVEGAADLTFYVEGQTVTFPGGKIIADGNVRGLDADYNETDGNTCGYWIETATNVEPIITRAENYHSEYPAFGEDFDDYETGMEFNFKNALPETCWEVKKTGSSSATVVANPTDANDQVLELKGSYTIRNVNMPANITAGDTYAEHQAWEVSVTLPSDMAADAELVLLNATSEKKKSNDGGFKIAGGKVYYSQNGEYVELEGVTLAAGTEYTLKREVDFTNAEALLSNYYVYDASGALLGSAKKVAMAEVTLPVASINLMATNVNGEAVLLDDYKLYPTKTATDFELYTAKLGKKVEDLDKAVGEDVGYRLSWMNANNTEKTYSIVAAYYNGETLVSEEVIKEIKMAPNSEGIETGVAALGDKGQAIRVYVRDDNPAEEDPAGGDTNKTDNTGIDTILLIAIAAAAVILIAMIVVIVVVSSKKKAKKAPEAAEAVEAPAVEEAASENEETPETDAE